MDHGDTAYLQSLHESRSFWDDQAAAFDEAPDHGLHDPAVRAAWMALLESCLPPPRQGALLDLGCGTGTLSLILAGWGYAVTGIDLSPGMIAQAERKAQAAGRPITFHVMDAAFPDLPGQTFDVLVCRHLLWALPEPAQVLRRWAGLLNPSGRLLLIEGFWHTGGGLHPAAVLAALPDTFSGTTHLNLSDRPALWGGPVQDERYLVAAEFRP